MSVLRNLEAKLGGIVEGAFGRAFKTSVQPVELAHKLAKEMEENQMVSVSRVYVPNHYRVFLSPRDRDQFTSYEPALRKELSDYLLEHARQERLALTSRPQIEFHTDDRLDLGGAALWAVGLLAAHAALGDMLAATTALDQARGAVAGSIGAALVVVAAAQMATPAEAWRPARAESVTPA